MTKSTDLFGEAIRDRFNGVYFPFYFEISGQIFEHNLSRYFRNIKTLSKSEKQLISLCYGDILDVGCGTGNYFPALNGKGKVIGLDNSPLIIEVAHKMGNSNCLLGDIFNYNINGKFDTITMFENNLGIGGTVDATKILLNKLSNLLNNNGQILINLYGRARDVDFIEANLTPIYKNIKGESFKWMNFNKKFLSKLCGELGLILEIISANRYYSLVRIKKK